MQKLVSLELLIRPTIILLYMYIYLFVRPQQLRVLGYDQKGPSINIGEKIWLNFIIVVCAWTTTVGCSSFNKLLNGGIKLTLNRTNTQVIETSLANNNPSQALTDTWLNWKGISGSPFQFKECQVSFSFQDILSLFIITQFAATQDSWYNYKPAPQEPPTQLPLGDSCFTFQEVKYKSTKRLAPQELIRFLV